MNWKTHKLNTVIVYAQIGFFIYNSLHCYCKL